MIRIGICEKSKKYVSVYNKILNKSMKKNRKEYEIDLLNPTGLLSLIENGDFEYDILILDLFYATENKSGVAIGKRVNEIRPGCQLIYCTECETVEESYETKCCYFLRKKNIDIYMERAVEKAIGCLMESLDGEMLRIVSNGKAAFVRKRDIIYIERDARKINIAVGQTVYPCNMTLKNIQQNLNQNMVRVHGGYIVNTYCVKRIHRNKLELENGIEIPLGKTFASDFLRKWKDYSVELS